MARGKDSVLEPGIAASSTGPAFLPTETFRKVESRQESYYKLLSLKSQAIRRRNHGLNSLQQLRQLDNPYLGFT
jgi:hypothetical protein